MRDLVDGFISHRLSRRRFVKSLAALGVSATGIASTIEAAEAVTAQPEPMSSDCLDPALLDDQRLATAMQSELVICQLDLW